jgi:flagellar FliL protein
VRIARIGLLVAVQIALALALVHWVGRPWLAGERFPWRRPVARADLGPLVPMDEILVNVAETGGRRYFRASLALEMQDGPAELLAIERMPVLRGRVNALFSGKTLEQLVEPSARDTLRLELLETLNAEVGAGACRDIHFTEFLVQ